MLQGPLYMALFRKSKDWGSKPYIGGIVYPTEMKGDMTFTKFRSYALLEGRDIYAKKLLDRPENKSWGELKTDMNVYLEDYLEGFVSLLPKNQAVPPRPVLLLRYPCTYESFLMFVFKEGGLANVEKRTILMNCGHPMPETQTFVDNNETNTATNGLLQTPTESQLEGQEMGQFFPGNQELLYVEKTAQEPQSEDVVMSPV